MHEVIEEECDQKEVDGFKWKHQWEAMMSSSFEGADNEVLTDAVTWRYFLVTTQDVDNKMINNEFIGSTNGYFKHYLSFDIPLLLHLHVLSTESQDAH
ncbi:hypothetical protein Tco_0303767 [Tanacetum coccineum]